MEGHQETELELLDIEPDGNIRAFITNISGGVMLNVILSVQYKSIFFKLYVPCF